MTEKGIIYGSAVTTRELSKKEELKPEDLTIDIGAKDKEDALKHVSLGDTIHKSGQGVPVTLVSIPLRYMHTPAELGSLKDMEACIELLAEFLCEVDENIDLKWF